MNANVRLAHYNNLSPGEYVFEVVAANSDKIWNYNSRKLYIKILPPWWNTVLAKVLYLLGIVLILFVVYRKSLLKLIEEKEEIVKKVQESLFEEKNQLRTLIDNLPDFIYIKDRESRFIMGNQRLADVLKVKSVQAMYGKRDHDFYPKELADIFYSDEQELMASGLPLIGKEEAGLDEKGNKVFISSTKIPLKNNAGKVIGLVGIGRDITALKEAQHKLIEQSESLQEVNVILEERQEEIQQQSQELLIQRDRLMNERNQLRTLIDNMPDVIYFKDKEARFITANKTIIKVMKAGTLENLVGKTDFDFYEEGLAQRFYNDDMEIIKSGQPIINKEEPGFDMYGKQIYVSTTKIPLKNSKGEAIGMVGIGRDI
ncbi:MAG: PAS domain-containing protein, partial [Bacteroidales bacterium]|nr:PAS domain-containing protein [Bacteroidales bacterium]